ncbi:MAG: RluA family pseudouridine synthase [Chitinophagales bacterium]|nr:RluA family pseudouridine synthase [Chitinophagales bacterium]
MNLEDKDIDTIHDEDELIEHFRFIVDKGQSPLRIDKFLTEKIPNVSRNKIQQAATAENILVNDKVVKSNYKIKGNDIIRVVMPEPKWDYTVQPENIPLDIIYEDDDIMVINKPAGMVCHPGHGNYTGTLVNALLWHCKDLPNVNGDIRPGLVHRIDRYTSGLMVIGKTELALNHLAKQFFDRTIDRKYIALAWGDVDEDKGRIEGNIARNPNNRKIFYVDVDGLEGKPAATNYEVIKRYSFVTLVECKLETGRTHQIRVHLKYIGHTIFGDVIYGGDQIRKGTVYTKYKQFIDNCLQLMPHQALHAKSLGFIHPTNKQKMYFEQALPENFTQLLEKWDRYSGSLQNQAES